MTANITLALVIGVLYAVGTHLLLQRTLTRVVLGLALLSHGANLLLLVAGGPAGLVPFVEPKGDAFVTRELGDGGVADPLPQAMVLTAIVITFGVTAFLLAMAYRSWVLTRADEVQDDVEDRRVLRLAAELDDEAREELARRRREREEAEGDGPEPAPSAGAPGAAP